MPRVLGIDIPGRKRLEYALTYIYGLGLAKSREVIAKAGLDPAKKADDLTDEDITKIGAVIREGYVIEGDLRREITQNIRRLISINSYRGSRHRRGLPARGQRTKTNARSRKGPKRTVGAVRGKEARSAAKIAGR
ncbi:30S ribosomal protein S13 [Tichowtungia aerotolerans]|uniref:Small ribosomal subunit protein uS13 n=1 Tax=Tichowtungia aerotolerans TaxID=2697043 RepID=A0A6P1MBV3_9BACT|nr:30S ribosomal protein S13 [Tichowtungia aerotolerans]QHI69568.1 30S ribosomal protein S13 [Tichowtungia aerotolerans]